MTSVTARTGGVPLHICLVVKDRDKTTEFLPLIWGLGPWSTLEVSFGKDDVILGEPFSIKVALASLKRLGIERLALEVIEPTEGTVYQEFLETKGEGLHHIAYGVSNWDEAVSKLREQGCKMTVAAIQRRLNKRWCYFETEPGGMLFELYEQ